MAYLCLLVGLGYPFFVEVMGSTAVTYVAAPLYVFVSTVIFQYFTYTSLEDNPTIFKKAAPPAEVANDDTAKP